MKFYLELQGNTIVRPYHVSDESTLPESCVEVSETLCREYITWNNKGYQCKLVDGVISKVHKKLTEEYLAEVQIKEIKELLTNSDTTQLLDNRLNDSKRIEFESYRESLRSIVRDLKNGAILSSDVILPEAPTYE